MQEFSQSLQIEEAAAYLSARMPQTPEIGLILGSGLGVLAEVMENAVTVPYRDIPHFPISTVEGHAGEMVMGTVKGKPAVLMNGRFHLYEGHDAAIVAFPIRVMKRLGVKKLLVTNAAGGINTRYRPGDLMLIGDHINLMARSPLIGPNDPSLGVRFPDMSEAYSRKLRGTGIEAAKELGISLQEGVYAAVLGPSYETPAEIRMMRHLGADAVGMSTVPEVIAARHAGIDVLGISCITNMAAGILDEPLSHQEVMDTADRVKGQFTELVLRIMGKL